MSRNPLDVLMDRAEFRCLKCNALKGDCDCWTECRCGWSFEAGEACCNPVHEQEARAETVATLVAGSVDVTMREMYPEPMRHASGGFRKTLRGAIIRDVKRLVLREIEDIDAAPHRADKPPLVSAQIGPKPQPSKVSGQVAQKPSPRGKR